MSTHHVKMTRQGHKRNQQWGFVPQQNFSSPLNIGTNIKAAQQPVSNVDTNTLVKSVVNDMTSAEKGGQWLISCYAPFKDKQEFPGFEDHSFEEDRCMYYEAMKNGLVDQYKQHRQNVLQQTLLKVKMLQNPNSEIVNMLKNIYNSPPRSSVTSNVFAGKQEPVFGNTARTSNAFASSTQSSSIFGQSPQNNQQALSGATMGNPVYAATNKSLFGQQPNHISNTPFGNNQQQQNGQQNLFASPLQNAFPNTQQNSGNVFDNKSPFGSVQNNNSLFNAQPNNNHIFGTQPSSIFNTQPQSSNVFGRTTTGAFGQQQQNVFANTSLNTQPTNSVFAPQTSLTNSPFSSQTNNSNNTFNQIQPNSVSNHSTSLFAIPGASAVGPQNMNNPSLAFHPFTQNNTSSNNSIFPSSADTILPKQNSLDSQIFDKAYSKLEDLSESDIKWFQSDDLDIENIPTKPPTYEMCF